MNQDVNHDFFSLNPETLLDAIEQFGVRCTGRVLQLNSMENRVYEIQIEQTGTEELSRHESYRVAKFYRPHRWSRDQILDEHGFLLDLDERDIPVVPPLKTPAGETLLETPGGILFSLFPKSGGRIPQEFTDEELERMGRLVARLHTIGAMRPAPARLVLNPSTYGLNNLAFILDRRLLPSEYESPYARVVEEICSRIEPFFSGIESIRIHGDLHLANILWDTQGPKLVDFDDMLTGPPIQDLWLMVPGRDDESKRQFQTLLYGYKQLRSFDESTLRLIEPLRALRMIHFSAWIGKRWDDPAFRRVFSHYGTTAYWAEQIADLRDQLLFMHE